MHNRQMCCLGLADMLPPLQASDQSSRLVSQCQAVLDMLLPPIVEAAVAARADHGSLASHMGSSTSTTIGLLSCFPPMCG